MYIIVAGGGKVGYYLTKTLVNEGYEILLIEKNPKKVAIYAERFGSVVMEGDAAELSTLEAAGSAPRQSPATWVAFGAAWSGGSISGAGNPPVPPPPYATAQAVRAAVLTALAKVNWRERQTYLNASVMSALKLIDPDLVKT